MASSEEISPEIDAKEVAPSWMQETARLGDLFSQLMTRTLSQRLLEELPEPRRLELTLAQMNALRYVWLHQNVLIGDLAEGLDISFPSATNMVKRLEEKSLLGRAVNPKDRRQVGITLTELGNDLVEQVERERISRFNEFLGRMSNDERSSFLQGLRSFLSLSVGEDICTADEVCLRCGWRASSSCPLADTIPLFSCR